MNDPSPSRAFLPFAAAIVALAVLGLAAFAVWLFRRSGRRGRLIVVLAAAGALILCGRIASHGIRQRRIVEAIWEARGSARFPGQHFAASQSDSKDIPPWQRYLAPITEAHIPGIERPELLEDLSALNDLVELRLTAKNGEELARLPALGQLKELDLFVKQDPDAALAYVAQLPRLESLTMRGDQPVSDQGASRLAQLTNLQSLTIYPSTITDKSIDDLASLQLRELELNGSRITDKSLERLAAMPLERLFVGDTAVTNNGIQQLRRQKPGADIRPVALPGVPAEAAAVARLSQLGFKLEADPAGRVMAAELTDLKQFEFLDDDKISPGFDEVVDAVVQLPELRRLALWNLPATETGMKKIARLKNLQELELLDAGVSDAELAAIAGLARLKTVRLNNSPITDAGLETIGQFTRLEELNMPGCKVRGEGLRHLANLKQLRELSLQECPLEDDALHYLTSLPHLEWLSLDYTPITDKGLKSLEKLPLQTQVNIEETKSTPAGVAALNSARLAHESQVENDQ